MSVDLAKVVAIDVHTHAERNDSAPQDPVTGELLAAAEERFDALVTTDRNLRYQQNLAGRKLAILVLPTTSWPRLERHAEQIATAVSSLKPGEYRELPL